MKPIYSHNLNNKKLTVLAEPNYFLEIESTPNNLITVEEFVNYFSVELGLDQEKINGLLLAVTEATTNAIIHGNKNNKLKMVRISVFVEGKDISIVIKDEGKGFDPSIIPDPTDPENLLKDSGRGLYLMRVYMDGLSYNQTPEGTETILKLKM
ncbi:MAG TPA: ATP-binding protein [Ignavibacteriaceae bacterium]|nr:ATP-binding protein [Ignavibacterium sp.]HMN23413.1 ATP-binding protein [Ignavibacteriaceae bacterium]HRN25536.1 ATP-binding protein [Ignavibacteriaceae bacterium]HRP92693.1 ATP-binding protein [Ignavibacteriaceae bacterium]HRQ53121.1 ATP-binding protein [Ignavibacteriaceae bacterium]